MCCLSCTSSIDQQQAMGVRGARSAQHCWPPTSLLFTQVPLVEEQHCPLQWPAEPAGPAHARADRLTDVNGPQW